MIRVNLLPPEKRHRERTPLSRMAALGIGTAVNVGIVIYMVVLALDTQKLKNATDGFKTEIKTLSVTCVTPPGKPPCDYDRVKAEVDRIASRETAVALLKKERTLMWSEVLDWICDVVAQNQWTWLTNLEMGEGGARGAGAALDLSVTLGVNSTASADDCAHGRVPDAQTKFKNDLWEKFKITPGRVYLPSEKHFPFDYAEEKYQVLVNDDTNYLEYEWLQWTATFGRQQGKPH